jgi:flavorubredoxin
LKGLKPANLIGTAFGSFGWSGEAVRDLEAMLREMKVDIAATAVSVRNVPNEAALQLCNELGKTIAAELKKKAASN